MSLKLRGKRWFLRECDDEGSWVMLSLGGGDTPRGLCCAEFWRDLIVQDYIEQGAVDLQSAFGAAGVVDEAQLAEPVHEEADAGSGCADHFSQSLLTDLGDYGFWNAVFAEMSEQQKDAGQPLFAGVEKLIDQIFFVADISGQ